MMKEEEVGEEEEEEGLEVEVEAVAGRELLLMVWRSRSPPCGALSAIKLRATVISRSAGGRKTWATRYLTPGVFKDKPRSRFLSIISSSFIPGATSA
ncbi:hypothetical protein PoB_003463800 [Plakobranchus ocellatus]|uniref:Uncharacterized protein n=1 Tax=Plakobranchus ocellatus TaxID=259542 RepID=A0AAV4AMW1_9GAST|nr:hypothetical protein PoB_003463800 [Plakobranchus ocellatus]